MASLIFQVRGKEPKVVASRVHGAQAQKGFIEIVARSGFARKGSYEWEALLWQSEADAQAGKRPGAILWVEPSGLPKEPAKGVA